MTPTIRLLLLLLLQAVSLPTFAQIEGLKLKRIGTEAGLSQANATCILQDSRGFMWFGTRDGLNKYDGYSFTIYRNLEDDRTSISNNFISSLIEVGNGDIWIGTWGGGVNRYNRKTKLFSQVDTAFSNTFVNSLMKDSEGNVWICTDGQGMYKMDPKTGKYTRYYNDLTHRAHLGDNDISTVFEDSRHQYWIGTATAGLYCFDGRSNAFTRFVHSNSDTTSLASNAVRSIYEDPSHRLWIGTMGGGLDILDPNTGKFRHFFGRKTVANLNMVKALTADKDGNLWVGMDNGGLVIIGASDGQYHAYKQDDIDNTSLSNNSIDCVYRDRQDNMWLGTYGAGANLFINNTHNFLHYRHSTEAGSLSNNNVLSIFEDSRDNLWVSTDGGGLDLLDTKRNEFRHFLRQPSPQRGISGNYVLALAEDRHGNLWAGTWGDGITIIDKTKTRFQTFKNVPSDTTSLAYNNVYGFARDKEGRMWIGTYGAGLDRFDESTRRFIHYRHDPSNNNSLASDRVKALLADSKGILWIGTFDGGLDRFDWATKTFTHYRHESSTGGLSNNSVNCLYEDRAGDIWVGTAVGLNRLEPATGHITVYSIKDGLPGSVIFGILQDDKGNYWVGTNKGLYRFDPKTRYHKTFATDDGLQADAFKEHACFKCRCGRMYFGGPNGFNAFYPDSIKLRMFDAPLVITGFQIFNTEVPVSTDDKHPSPLKADISETKELILDHSNSVITFRFASLNYTAPHRRRYRYMLEGFDKDWTAPSNKHTVTYTNLDPGTYIFKVNALNSDGRWPANPTTIRLTIVPPFWLTTWFRILVVGILIAVAIGIHQVRLRNIRRHRKLLLDEVRIRTTQLTLSIEEERKAREVAESASKAKSEFLANMSHELRTPMNAIIGFTDLVLSSPLHQVQRDYIEHVSRAGYNLLGLINAVLDYSKIEAGKLVLDKTDFNLARLVEETVGMLAIKGLEKGLDVACEIDQQLPELFRGDSLRIQQILVNLIGNGIKFTEKGGVFIQVKMQESLSILVRDTGIGIPADKLDTIFESFTQGDSSTTRKYGGTGLGLTIARTLAEMMHGNLTVSSKVGEGTTFTLTLNLEVAKEAPVPSAARTPTLRNVHVDDDNAGKQQSIMIVEDDPINMLLISEVLSKMGFQVIGAENGREALTLLETNDIRLIFMDINMPEMDGIESTRRIRLLPTPKSAIPIVALTADAMKEDRERCLAAGMNGFLAKPFRMEELKIMLAQHLSKKASAAAR